MGVTFADFIAAYPEFSETGETMVQKRLDDAERDTPKAMWGARQDKGIMLRAAHALATGPSGSNASVDGPQETTYSRELKPWIIVTAAGHRVI